MAKFVKKCPCLRPKIEAEVRLLDYRHCSLTDVPGDVFNYERTLEELLIDSNQIKELPRELFYCHGLRRLSISDNEIKTIPPAIATLISLEQVDLSKNGIINIPEDIKCCKYLRNVDASVNPLGKLPDGFTQLLNLSQLYLNDTFLDYLPGNFGRLSRLKILEIRENHLKTLPKSFSRLTELEKLDIGHNEFIELPDVIGSLSSLLELWCDHNQITSITPTIGNLKQLMFFDGCKNAIQSLPSEIEGCSSLADIHLTTNQLEGLPDSIGNLNNLTTLKVDDNQLRSLPTTIGGLTSLSELNVSANNLQDLPSSLGLLRYLRTLYADDNDLEFIPAEIGSCSGITVLSLRSNRLAYIPDELGRIPRLRVINLSSNQLQCLPFTFVKLKELQALWLSENQTRPLIPLQSEHDPETGRKLLTCYLLPQRPPQDSGDPGGDNDSFHASMWDEERRSRQLIHFDFGDDSDVDGNLVRQPTPYPKEMREKLRHLKNMQTRQTLSSGAERRSSQGQDNPAYDVSPSMERLSLISPEGDARDHKSREPRSSKSGSPSLQDPYTLFKFDKERLAKEKARMQHQHNSQSGTEGDAAAKYQHSPTISDRSSKRGKTKKPDVDDDGGFGEHASRVTTLGSAPDIPSASDGPIVSPHRRFTYYTPELSHSSSQRSQSSEQTSKSASSHHSHHRSHRHRRMREYDSDTGYRSDQEIMKFRRQQEQMFMISSDNHSEIVPVVTRKGRRRDGYSSDLEGYSRLGMVAAYRDASKDSPPSANSNNSPYVVKKSQTLNSSSQGVVRNDELYDKSVTDRNHTHYPSPSPLRRISAPFDQSTPLVAQSSKDNVDTRHSNPNSQTAGSHGNSAMQMDWKREPSHAGDQRVTDDHSGDQQNRYIQQNYQSNSDTSHQMLPPYKPAPQYNTAQETRKLPPTPHKSSPYGVSAYDRQARASPMKDYTQRMPNIQEFRDGRNDIPRPQTQNDCHSNDLESDLSRTRPQADCHSNERDKQVYRTSEGANVNYLNMHNESPRTPDTHRANKSSASLGVGEVTPASSKDSGNSSYYERTSIGESPVNVNMYDDRNCVKNSPRNGGTDRRNSQNSFYDYNNELRNFGRGNNFQTPTTVDIPTRYDDIAIFKNSEPPSQVSSSTEDSGYGQGHHIFDKMSQRFSGASQQSSPSPDQLHSDSPGPATNRDSSSQYSRGATPVNHNDSQSSDVSVEKLSRRSDRFRVNITKNPGLGFSIAGGVGSYGNPFRPGDMGIFVTKVQPNGPAADCLKPGDKLLEVNGTDYSQIQHSRAVNLLTSTGGSVSLYVEREPS